MNCPRCNVPMVTGKAIKPGLPAGCFCPSVAVTAETLELLVVLKCPQCGHSDDGKASMTPDQIAQWRKAYISTLVGNGMDLYDAEQNYDAGGHDFSDSPVAAAYAELEQQED